MTKVRPWTDEEDQLVLENWPKMNVRELAKTLNRFQKDVARRLTRLRKAGHYVPYVGKKWTAKEDRELVELRPDKTTEEISKLLNRTPGAILTRIKHLRKMRGDAPETVIDANHPRGGFRWEEEETLYFIDNIDALGIGGMAEKLQRTELAIACRVEMHCRDNEFDQRIVTQAEGMLKPYRSENGECSNYDVAETKGDDAE